MKIFSIKNDKIIEFSIEKHLSREEAMELIINYPRILPFIQDNKYLVVKEFRFKDLFFDIALFVRDNNKVSPYLLDFSIYGYGELIDEENYPPANAVWDIGLMSEEVDWMISDIGSKIARSRRREALILRNRIREELGLRRLSFNETELIYVVNDITEDFKSFIDIMNEEHETYISGLAVKKYLDSRGENEIYFVTKYPE